MIDRERQSPDQLLVGHYIIVSRGQDSVDAFEKKGVAEDDRLALCARGHRSYAAAARVKGYWALAYKRRISLPPNLFSSTSR